MGYTYLLRATIQPITDGYCITPLMPLIVIMKSCWIKGQLKATCESPRDLLIAYGSRMVGNYGPGPDLIECPSSREDYLIKAVLSGQGQGPGWENLGF